MTTLAFDDTGARYYETGVSKGILFPIDGTPGVPWNGLVSVNLDPQGGEHEAYYFDGVKYMDRILAEDFQATIQALSTPPEFAKCEGDREYKPGVMTSFGKRDKFHMAWRTEIGSDQGESVGHKIHIAYNNLVQPSSRAYQTIADTVTMSNRSFVITATPACGRNSYFWFDSRYYDLADLEEQLYQGILPKCYELADLVTPVGPDVPPADPDEGCESDLVDFENYVHGTTVNETLGDTTHLRKIVQGVINDGLDIIVLPAEGAFAANDSAASEVGTHPVLVDDDDATYVSSADGDLGYTVGLPPLVGYVEGCQLELHIRMSITGGVNPDDPDNMDADAQVHISTDATGDDTIGGFSDGTDEGMGFALTSVDGTITDYVVPLSMDAWVDTTITDVVTALEEGAYLNILAVSNNNPDTTPAVEVYEASVVMLNDTDPGKWLRPDPDNYCRVDQNFYNPDTTDLEVANTQYIDFKVLESVLNVDYDGLLQPLYYNGPGEIDIETYGDHAALIWYDDTASTLLTVELVSGLWYRAALRWGYEEAVLTVAPRETNADIESVDETWTDAPPPIAGIQHYGGYIGTTERTWEVVLDNSRLVVHCNDEAPDVPVLPDIVIDLPAWKVGDFESDNLSTPDTSTEMELPDGFGQDHFGVGYYAEELVSSPTLNIYLPDTPDGYVLSHATYVVIAWKDSSETLLPSGDWSPDSPDPVSQPFLMIDSSFSPVDNKTLSPIPTGAYDGETVWPGNDLYGVTHNVPANRLWLQRTGSGHQHIAYLAVRLTYTQA